MKKVLTYGTFDLLHIGHINILRRAKEQGDYLVVGLSTDEFNEIKGKKTILPYKERAEIVRSLKFVDEVIPESNWEQKVEDVKNHDIDTFVMGNDWEGKFDFLKEFCKVIYLERTEHISSTKLKEELTKLNKLHEVISTISKEDITNLIAIVEKINNLK